MPIDSSCARVAVRAGSLRLLPAVALLAASFLSACATAPSSTSAQAPKPPREALAFDDSVTSLTTALFARAQLDPNGPARRTLVIDPLIDRATGNQAASTRSMERQMAAVVRERFPQFEPRPFTPEELDAQPLLLAGSITTVAGPGIIPAKVGGEPNTYRIWAVLADLRTGKIVSHETAWLRTDGVDMTPTEFFRNSPAWAADPTMAAYLRTCAQDPGAAIDPAYLAGVKAAAYVAEGIRAYEDGRYQEALTTYMAAQELPSGDQMRVYNGLYLTNVALGRQRPAEEAFEQLVDAGLSRGKLAVKFVFRPASTGFWPDRAVSGPYPMWLRQIARRTAARPSCLRLVGHTSPTGDEEINDVLSRRRALAVRQQLINRAPPLNVRTTALGRGSREPLVGTGRDDATDVLDRRVEFEPFACDTQRADVAAGSRIN